MIAVKYESRADMISQIAIQCAGDAGPTNIPYGEAGDWENIQILDG